MVMVMVMVMIMMLIIKDGERREKKDNKLKNEARQRGRRGSTTYIEIVGISEIFSLASISVITSEKGMSCVKYKVRYIHLQYPLSLRHHYSIALSSSSSSSLEEEDLQ